MILLKLTPNKFFQLHISVLVLHAERAIQVFIKHSAEIIAFMELLQFTFFAKSTGQQSPRSTACCSHRPLLPVTAIYRFPVLQGLDQPAVTNYLISFPKYRSWTLAFPIQFKYCEPDLTVTVL